MNDANLRGSVLHATESVWMQLHGYCTIVTLTCSSWC